MLRIVAITAVLAASLWGYGPRTAIAAQDFTFYYENVLGTSLELRVEADSAAAARRAEARVLEEVDRLAGIFSGYDPASEFSRWQGTVNRPTRLSTELLDILQECDRWGARSGGAFDPRVQALSQLWARATRLGRMPTPGERTEARSLMSRPAWRIDPASRTAEHLSDCPLSLNAIAKGAIIDRACAAAMKRGSGVRGVLLNIGGDLRACGETPRTVGIASPSNDSETSSPLASIEIRDRSVASSGNYQRRFVIGRRHDSHIFDPRSGLPVDRIVGATVIAGRAADADALATIFSVLPIEESLRLADALPEVECLLVDDDGEVHRSEGWGRYETQRPAPAVLASNRGPRDAAAPETDVKDEKATAPRAAWNDDFELLVTFEINRPEGDARRLRRPYVAVWVEDRDGFPVRTLTLWVQAGGPGPRWIPDLRRWYRGDQARRKGDDTSLVDTIARATRPPGKYEVLWDGNDDLGQPLGAGEYTVSIEAAREHGTYQIIRTPVTLADRPFVKELKGNVEIKSASVAYRRKGPG